MLSEKQIKAVGPFPAQHEDAETDCATKPSYWSNSEHRDLLQAMSRIRKEHEEWEKRCSIFEEGHILKIAELIMRDLLRLAIKGVMQLDGNNRCEQFHAFVNLFSNGCPKQLFANWEQ